jgi:putative glutamine amidotransferase
MINNKPVIGVLATSNYMVTNDSFADTYRYGNNYIKKILDNGGIPLLIPYVDDRVIFESLEMCDGLILPGGNRVLSSSLEVIDYFYKSNKPILGICLGMQTLAMYSVNKDREEAKRIIKVIDNGVDHWPFELYRDSDSQLAHKLKIDKNSKLYKILKEENLEVNSVHKCTITEVGRGFKVSAYSEDGLIEGIEYDGDDKFIVGVQFHPEVLPQFNNIFEVFLDECKKEQ